MLPTKKWWGRETKIRSQHSRLLRWSPRPTISPSLDGYETPPEEPFVEVEISEQEQRGGEPVETAEGNEQNHTPTNDRRETGPVAARNDREEEGPPAEEEVRKCLDATFSFPHDVYSFLQDTSYERAKDVQEFQEAVLSVILRGGFGFDGQDAAELAFADKPCNAPPPKKVGEALLARPSVELTPDGEHEEPSLEFEAKRARFEVDLKVEADMKSVGKATEPQHGGDLAQLDDIGMTSGQPPGEEGRRDPATKATVVESGQPQVKNVERTEGTTRSSDYPNFLAEAEMKAVDPDQCLDMDDSEADDLEDTPDRVAAVLIGPLRNGSDGREREGFSAEKT